VRGVFFSLGNGGISYMEHITEMKVGRTIFIVTEEFSQNATETVGQKLKKLIAQHAFDSLKCIRKLSDNGDNQLAIHESKCEYDQ
jgi:hypothetical protein